jgi:hypothetical protein
MSRGLLKGLLMGSQPACGHVICAGQTNCNFNGQSLMHDRRRGPVSEVLNSIAGDGKRYQVTTGSDGVQITGASGYVTPGDADRTINVTGSTRSKGPQTLPHDQILKIEDARAARDGSRTVHYERPEHRQSGYGRT